MGEGVGRLLLGDCDLRGSPPAVPTVASPCLTREGGDAMVPGEALALNTNCWLGSQVSALNSLSLRHW
jgi:hypothetical protein